MTDFDDPVRLADGADAPVGLGDLLRDARADLGSEAEVARLAAKLGPLLGPTVPLAPAPAATPALGAAAKLGVGALALLVAGGASLFSARTGAPPAPASAPSTVVSIASPPRAVPPSVVESPGPELAPSAERPSPPVKALATTPPSEAALLEQARAALKSGDSARALQRASEHAHRYPRGILIQEREVLAIQALRRLGRDAEADRRADAFAKAYPGSAFQRKLHR